MKKRLKSLLGNLNDYRVTGTPDVSVTGIADDNRKVKNDNIFVAIKGLTVDGHNFISGAIKSGASAIVGERNPRRLRLHGKTYVKVPNSRKALSLLASSWYGNPSKKLKFLGVTGTDGKTTTATLIYWILKKARKKVGLISTVSAKIGNKEYDTGFHVTNPEPLYLQKFLSLMVRKGCEYAVLEVTSHGLDQERVAGIEFEISVLTNITHEHLDYHKSYLNYVKAKAKLFMMSKTTIVNKLDKSFGMIKKIIGRKNIVEYPSVLSPILRSAIETRFPEDFNKLNAQAAINVCKRLGISERTMAKAIRSFPTIKGRMDEIKNSKGLRIIVDFAHTSHALESVLKNLRGNLKRGQRLICVFGCPGERDKEKRPIMGEISARLANVSIFTADDPRTEDVNSIIGQIVKGARRVGAREFEIRQFNGSNHYPAKHWFARVSERGEAIALAIQEIAQNGDIIVICGKGHERSLPYGNIEYEWSDRGAVKKALSGGIKAIRRNDK